MPKEENLPETYKTNTDQENVILSCCENFRRQFVHLYRDRKPLLLCPLNEGGIEVHTYHAYIFTSLPNKGFSVTDYIKFLRL